jgi:predicted GIY-YIG superfamily endonuclease
MIFDDTPRHYRLYVLQLEDGKYYVGVTSRTALQRMREHQQGIKSAYWTEAYKPIRILRDEPLGLIAYKEAIVAEQKKVLQIMKEHGVNSVRGGDLRERGDYALIGKYVFSAHDRDAIIIVAILLVIIAIQAAVILSM